MLKGVFSPCSSSRHLGSILIENLASRNLHGQRAPMLNEHSRTLATTCRRLCSLGSSIQCSACPKYARTEAVLFSRITLLYSFRSVLHQFSLPVVLEPVNMPIKHKIHGVTLK